MFNAIVGAGDFTGDGTNDILARDGSGLLYLYRGGGEGGWLPALIVGSDCAVVDRIIATGDTAWDGEVDIYGVDHRGWLHQYPADGRGGGSSPRYTALGGAR